ncbi:Calponin-1 [Folsomia candida]|uniref:Transgelin n=1 Tax=Folsomia candida TaxID=158441 RepID=A0A226CXJ0_FOLCA|nr:Calponin-1 [Folsomia candida]
MAYHGPSYGLSRECHLKAQAKFNLDRAKEAVTWVEAVVNRNLTSESNNNNGNHNGFDGVRDQLDFAVKLKDGVALCELINKLCPNAVKKINTSPAPFKQRENLEMFLKGCETYGMKSQDLFQVNDLYENKNLYMVVDCLFSLGGMAQKNGFDGARLGVRVSNENKRNFTPEKLAESNKIIGLQYGSNRGASQAGMGSFGNSRKILPDGERK